MMNHYKKMSVMKHFFKKCSSLKNLPINDQKFGTCESVYFQVKLRSEVAIQKFPEQILKTAGDRFHSRKFIIFILIFS